MARHRPGLMAAAPAAADQGGPPLAVMIGKSNLGCRFGVFGHGFGPTATIAQKARLQEGSAHAREHPQAAQRVDDCLGVAVGGGQARTSRGLVRATFAPFPATLTSSCPATSCGSPPVGDPGLVPGVGDRGTQSGSPLRLVLRLVKFLGEPG